MVSVAQLREQLEKTYEIVCFVDLADLTGTHKAIFELFKQNHQIEYSPNQRLILYSSYEPGQDFLDHIQRAAKKIDIDSFFILICCPGDITNKLKISNQRYGFSNVEIQQYPVDLYPTRQYEPPQYYPYATLCSFPFTGAFVFSNGNVAPCCKFEGVVGNVNQSTLKEIFHNDIMSQLRTDMKNGVKPTACRICWDAEAQNTTSMRQHGLSKHHHLLDQYYIDDIAIRDCTIAPSILCNFKCRICSSDSSSSIAIEQIAFTNNIEEKNNIKKSLKLKTQQSINKLINSVTSLDNIDYLHILGGEPFMWPELKTLLETLISNGLAPRIHLTFTTNCSIFPDDLITLLAKFKKIEISLSIDDVGDRFEVQRGGSWNKIYQNIINYVGLKSNKFCIKLMPTVNIQNLLYLDQVLDLSQMHNLEIVWLYLEDPSFMSIDNVTLEVKQLVKEKYQNHSNEEIKGIVQRVTNANVVDGTKFLEYINMIDQRRNQKFSDSHSEIFRAMGGCLT